MRDIRLGIIGLGNIGTSCHYKNIREGKVQGVQVAGVCDRNADLLSPFAKQDIATFTDSKQLIRSGTVDAVLIATPHYAHTTIGVDAIKQGLHVLVEKPISVHKADCERLIAAYRARTPAQRKKQVFAAMFNQRTDPRYQKIRQLIQDGELGTLRRVNWIITDWFRTEAYYQSGGWRATWKGEGGGVLVNQCPHQLDVLWWLCGLPKRITAHAHLGRWHDIEVEDDVTAILEYEGGAHGVFTTSTGEAPGTNRLEIVGTRGKLVAEGASLTFTRNEVPMDTFSATTDKGFAKPPVWNIDIPIRGFGGQHAEILQNFIDACRGTAALIAPAEDGIHSVEMGNAMLLSGITGKPVDLPMSGKAYERQLKKLIAASEASGHSRKKKKAGKKTARPASADDMASSF
ncbi:MAG: gfo/Idh/MocA family oxidoreductase [Planctomycetota bacterium]|nr:MAG: gfo/Idh/MocA family oxidoreductase [Planctomycetota bacterium]